METLQFAPGQNFDCSLCGKCCGGWRILADQEARGHIKDSLVELKVVQATGQSGLRRRQGEWELVQDHNKRCVYLKDDKLCGIQAELGPAAKPQGCKEFPFRLTKTPDGVFVGISFYCDAALNNQGRPLQAHQHSVSQLAIDEPMLGDQPMPLYGRIRLDWPCYTILEKHLSAGETVFSTTLQALAGLIAYSKPTSNVARPDLLAALTATQKSASTERALTQLYWRALAHLITDKTRQLPGLAKALATNQTVGFSRYQWSGLPHSLLVEHHPQWVEVELQRYLQSLLFRKFLITDRPIQSNLAILCVLPRLFRTIISLSQLGRKASTPQKIDLQRAFEDCEYYFATHSSDLDNEARRTATALIRLHQTRKIRQQSSRSKAARA